MGAGRDRSSSGTAGESGDNTGRPPAVGFPAGPESWRMIRGGMRQTAPVLRPSSVEDDPKW